MLFMEITTVYFENHKQLKSTPCGVNAGLLMLKQTAITVLQTVNDATYHFIQ
jgi:hypothetical protein